MTQSRKKGDGANPARVFRKHRDELDDLLAFARSASAALSQRGIASFQRFSDLLDEFLPAEPDREARIARAVAMDPTTLHRLRARELDPFQAPQVGIAQLAQALRLDRDRDAFRRLLASDHASFTATIARGGDNESAAWAMLDNALDRLSLDAP
jgi:hypothetical protein